MRPAKDRKTTLRLETDLEDRIELYADAHDMSKASVIRAAVREFLDNNEK